MDNRIFNVNGSGIEMLQSALMLACQQKWQCDKPATAVGWAFDQSKGLVLLWSLPENSPSVHKFPSPLTAEEVTPIIFSWLQSSEAKATTLSGWDAPVDHDGDNQYGWRVYVEDWGHVSHYTCSICAITPSYGWLGK